MKSKAIFLLLLVLATAGNVDAQNCFGDSIVQIYSHSSDYSDMSNSIETDTFDLTNGTCVACTTSGHNSLMSNISCQTRNFTRKYLELTSFGDTSVYVAMNGNGSGFDNTTRIEFTYDSITEALLNRVEYHGSGNVWTLYMTETWTYDQNGRDLYYVSYGGGAGGTFLNQSQINFSYSGNQLREILFQQGFNTSWLNDKRYLFTYDTNGFRDSIYVQDWNSIDSSWVDSSKAYFDPADSYCALLSYTNSYFDSTQSRIVTDSTCWKIDTLNHVIHNYNTDNYYYENIADYINYKQVGLLTYHYNSNYGCVNYGTKHYNSNGVYVGEISGSACVMPNDYSESTLYDSLYRPLITGSSHYSNTISRDSYSNYYYPLVSDISFSYIPVEDMNAPICQGDTLIPAAIISGGCGPYHFQWTPSTRLSSDTVMNPHIQANDPITYTVTVTDTTGNTATTYFSATSAMMATIMCDTTLCHSCPTVLTAAPYFTSGYTYQWYRNDTLVAGATNHVYTATIGGDYSVQIHKNTYQSCTAISNPLHITIEGLTRVQGSVYLDVDSDCVRNGADQPLVRYGTAPYMVKIEKGAYHVFVLVDSMGMYDVPLDTGAYQLSLVNPAYTVVNNCPPTGSLQFQIQNYGDTIHNADFAMKGLFNCSRLRVNVSAGLFRPCRSTSILVNCYNEGLQIENNAVAHVTLPPELTVTSAQLPYTLLPGNVLQFNLDPLNPGESLSFSINADVFCDAVGLNQATFCLHAEINPIDFCSFNPANTWDGSNVRVTSTCANDSAVCFTIRNQAILSGGDMHTSSAWRLYADNIPAQQGSFILNANQDTTLCFASTGQTYRLEADQNGGFPTGSSPYADIERCGQLDSGSVYSLNKILLHPYDNNLPFYNTYCGLVSNSFDPNLKSVSPEGWSTNHFVSKDDILTYRIDFQNAGNDTAFAVNILDTLDLTFLDLSTLNLISSSHPSIFALENGNILHWTFSSISLPDSNVNEPMSHGYVEFAIKPKTNTVNGDIIINTAAIIFDFNLPVVTPEVKNTICETKNPSVVISTIPPICNEDDAIYIANIQNGGTNPGIAWYVNGVQYPGSNDTLTVAGSNYHDSISCLLTSNYMCALPPEVASNVIVFSVQPPHVTITYMSQQLIASPASAYQWFFNDTLIPGAINQFIIPSATGNYSVEIQDANGCIGHSQEFYFLNVGLDEMGASKINLYPNPSGEIIYLTGVSPDAVLKLKDITGKEVEVQFEHTHSSGELKLDVSGLEPALYFLEISGLGMRLVKPVMIFRSK